MEDLAVLGAQLIAEIGVGYLDELLCTVGKRATAQICHAVLRYDVLHLVARGGHWRAAIQEQLDTGFTGTTVTHTFAPAQIDQWKGYDGTGLPEGILDTVENRLYL